MSLSTILKMMNSRHLVFSRGEVGNMHALPKFEKALGKDHASTMNIANNLGNLYSDQEKLAETQEMYELARDQEKLAEAQEMYELALAGFKKALGKDHASTLNIVNNLGNLYSNEGKFVEAEEIYERALVEFEKALGKDHASTLNIVNNLGNLYSDQGKLVEAEEMYKRALAGLEKALGRDHASTLNIVNNLGNLYSNQGKLVDAEEMYKCALAGKEKVLGKDHMSTLNTLNNLGNLYFDQGKLTQAEEMYKRAFAGKEKALGKDHLSTLNIVNNLGNLYFDQGKLAEAEKMYVRALERFKEALGKDHASTLNTINNLGNLYSNQGRLVEAEEMYEHALTGFEQALGKDHASTLNTINNLGNLYFDQGKLTKAEEMYKRALLGFEKALGKDHALTLNAVNNLGNLYSDQGRLAEAEEMYERALVGFEKALGKDHASTLNIVNNLGNLYSDQGRLAEAEEMYERAFAGFEKALGKDHSSTLNSIHNLCILYTKQGKLAEASEMYERALARREKAFGKDHALTLGTINNLGILYHKQGKLAKEMYEHALAQYRKALGKVHALTLTIVLNLSLLYKGKLEEGTKMYEHAPIGKEKTLGKDHALTLTTVNNLGLLYRDEDATSKRLMQDMHITVEEVEERKEVEDLQKRNLSSRPDAFLKVRSSESAICTENPNLKMVEEFITEINIGYDSGYFVSNAWMLSLDDHENEALTSALRQTGYLEIYKTDTTVFYEKINGLSCTPENNDFGDFVDPEVIASARSFEKRRQSAPVQSDQTPFMDSPKSIQDKGKMPLATSNEILESFKTAIQDTSLDNYSVSTQWLSTLSKQEEENLKFALLKAGYLEIERTSTTAYFERLQGHVCNNPKNESERSSIFQKRSVVGGSESRKALSGSEGLLADDRQRPNIDKQGSSSVTTTIQESHKREVTCPCHPQHLTVSCTPEPSEEPSTSSSSQGEHMSESSTRKAVGDSYVIMPITREGILMPTGADKMISMRTFSFSEQLASGGSGFNEVSLKVSAYTSLTCCLKSDPNEKKVRIELSTIGGRVQIEDNVNPNTNSVVLRSVRSNVNACIIRSGRTDHSEPSTREPLSLYVQESDARRPWRKVLETYELRDENDQPRWHDGLVWMQLSGNHPQNSELGSKTLELQCHVKNRLHYDRKMCCHDAHVLEFTDRDPVILEGKILGDLKSATILELNVRYQIVISYNEPRHPKAGQKFVVTTREDKTVDFDFVLKFRTRKFSSSWWRAVLKNWTVFTASVF